MSIASTRKAIPRSRFLGRGRRALWLLLVAGVLATGGGIGGWLWLRQGTAPPPPVVDLEGVDPAVETAIQNARQAVLNTPRSASAWGHLGLILSAFYYRTEAIACFAQAERLDPSQPRWPYDQALLLLLDNQDEAIARLRRALELCGDEPDIVRLRLSEALLSAGRLDGAEEGFQRLLVRDAHHPRALLGLGRVAAQRQQWSEAMRYLGRAAADPRTARSAAIALAEVQQRRGDEKAAAEWRERVEKLPPDPRWPDPFAAEVQRLHVGQRVRIMQANQLLKQARVNEALQQYDQVIQDYPDSADAWFSLGQALYRLHNYSGAERTLQKTVALAPGFAEAHNYLGLSQMKQGELTEAAASFRKAIDLKPDFALAYANLGSCCLQQKDTPGAREAFRAAVRCMPNYAPARVELAILLHQDHQDAEALEQARAALQLNPDDEQARKLVAELTAKGSHAPDR
jgi:tetratricopeptide (TPR) repeat protein